MARERKQCEFFLVRYVPDPVKDEFVNIGVLLREAAGNGEAATVVRFTRDWGRVRCVDPDADIAMLELLEGEIRHRLGEAGLGIRPIVSVLEDSFSNGVQLTIAKGYEAENLTTGIEQLMRLHVEAHKRQADSRKSGRQVIYGKMRAEFEREGVWDLMTKRIAAARYTQAGDPLKIDCGYRPNGTLHMFQAVSLEGDLEMAKVLAFSIGEIREGVRRVENANLELTAVVEPLGAWADKITGNGVRTAASTVDGDRVAQYRYAVDTMERTKIRVVTTSDLPRLAEAARRELRV